MALHYKTPGIILKQRDQGEANRIVTVFTKEFGKLELWAISERKIASKLRGGLELFSHSSLEFIEGKQKSIAVEAVCLKDPAFLKKDLGLLQAAFTIASFLDRVIVEREEDLVVWNLLEHSFALLEQGISPKEVTASFQQQLMRAAGYGDYSLAIS